MFARSAQQQQDKKVGGVELYPVMNFQNKKQKANDIENNSQFKKNQDNENEILVSQPDDGVKYLNTIQQMLAAQSDDVGGVEDGRLTRIYFGQFLRLEQCCCILNLLGLGISVIQYDLEYHEESEDISLILLWAIFLSTILLIVLTTFRYLSYLKWKQIRKDLSNKETLISSGMWINLTIELIVVGIIPLPFTMNIKCFFFSYNIVPPSEVYYHVNEILSLIMTLRMILICRTILSQSVWYTNRTQRVCNLYACEANYMFVIKSLMRSQPYEVIFTVMFSMIFLFGYMVRICESPLVRIDTNPFILRKYQDCMWNIIITMTTVGYGDFYARTDLGRLVIFIVCIFGVFVVSMMVVTLTNSLITTSLEGKAITVLERLEVRENLIHLAATVITLMARIGLSYKFIKSFYKKQRKGTITPQQHQRYLIRLRKAMNEFKVTMRLYKSIQDNGSVNEEMSREFDLLRSNFKDLMTKQESLVILNEQILSSIQGDSRFTARQARTVKQENELKNENIIVEKHEGN